MYPIYTHKGDLPDTVSITGSVCIDTEAMGLRLRRDRLCLVQVCINEEIHLVQIDKAMRPVNLVRMLEDKSILKIFHYGRFDITLLMHTFDIEIENVYCTKIASKLARTYTNKHSLKDLCKELLNIEVSKEEQASDWGAEILSEKQKLYAATDVAYLLDLKTKLDYMLHRENRYNIAQKCFEFLPIRGELDILNGEQSDVFSHSGDL